MEKIKQKHYKELGFKINELLADYFEENEMQCHYSNLLTLMINFLYFHALTGNLDFEDFKESIIHSLVQMEKGLLEGKDYNG